MKKILTIGNGMQDIFIQYKESTDLNFHTKENNNSYICIQAGKKIEIQNLLYYCGGGAANSAVSFARNNFEVSTFFKVGMDNAGDCIIKTLQQNNVSTTPILRTDATPTGQSFIFPGPQGNSPILIYRGANNTLTKAELPETLIAQADHLYITSLSDYSSPLILPIVQYAKKHQTSVTVNPGSNQLQAGAQFLIKALPYINILILNNHEAQLMMASLLQEPLDEKSMLASFFNIIHGYGPNIIVVTHGAEGVYISDKKTIYFHPSIKTKIMSTVGAGDAFGSCFVAHLLHNQPIETALRAGIINSASVIAHLDTQSGLLTNHEITTKLKLLDQSLLQTYTL